MPDTTKVRMVTVEFGAESWPVSTIITSEVSIIGPLVSMELATDGTDIRTIFSSLRIIGSIRSWPKMWTFATVFSIIGGTETAAMVVPEGDKSTSLTTIIRPDLPQKTPEE